MEAAAEVLAPLHQHLCLIYGPERGDGQEAEDLLTRLRPADGVTTQVRCDPSVSHCGISPRRAVPLPRLTPGCPFRCVR